MAGVDGHVSVCVTLESNSIVSAEYPVDICDVPSVLDPHVVQVIAEKDVLCCGLLTDPYMHFTFCNAIWLTRLHPVFM
jgi:hypothetical protein